MKNKLISNFINLYKEREELYVLLNSREFQKSIKHPELPLYSRIRKEFQEEMKLVRKINKLSEDLIRMYNEIYPYEVTHVPSITMIKNRDININDI